MSNDTMNEPMTFQEALNILGIEDYGERIFNSNSHGELFHLQDYFSIAKHIKNETGWFRVWFEGVVKFAEENWQRPESIFQHISKVLSEQIKNKTL